MLKSDPPKLSDSGATSVRPLGKRAGAIFMAAIGALIATFAPATAQAPGLGALDNAKKGLWEVRFRDGSAKERICVRSGRELIQLKHRGHACGRQSVETEGSEVTVQYACRGEGYGRTNLRVETSSLIQIDSHGVADELPFHYTAEARHVGSCG